MKNATRMLIATAMVAVALTTSGCASWPVYMMVNQTYHQKSSDVEFEIPVLVLQDEAEYARDSQIIHTYKAPSGSTYAIARINAVNRESEEKHLPLDAMTITIEDGTSYGAVLGDALPNGVPVNITFWKATPEHGVLKLAPGKSSTVTVTFLIPKGKRPTSINFFGDAVQIPNPIKP